RRRVRAVSPAAAAGVSGIARAGYKGPLRLLVLAGCVAAMALRAGAARPAETADVAWHPKNARIGDVAWLHVRDVPDGATVEGSVDGRRLTFFPYAGGQAALLGIDLETKPGVRPWRVAVVERGRDPRSAHGTAGSTTRRASVPRSSPPTRAAWPSSASASSLAAWSCSTTASASTRSTSISTRSRSARASASSVARRLGPWGPAAGRPARIF